MEIRSRIRCYILQVPKWRIFRKETHFDLSARAPIVELPEEGAASMENSIKKDTLTQTEYNEKKQDLYELWD